MEELMTIKEIADTTGLSTSTIYKKVCRREIPYIKLGNRLRFDQEEIRGWLEACHVSALDNSTNTGGK